jgi:hypothetical protein
MIIAKSFTGNNFFAHFALFGTILAIPRPPTPPTALTDPGRRHREPINPESPPTK